MIFDRIGFVSTVELGERVGGDGVISGDQVATGFDEWIDERLLPKFPHCVASRDAKILRVPRYVHQEHKTFGDVEFCDVPCTLEIYWVLVPSSRVVNVIIEFRPVGVDGISFPHDAPLGSLLALGLSIDGRSNTIKGMISESVGVYWPERWSFIESKADTRTTFGWVGTVKKRVEFGVSNSSVLMGIESHEWVDAGRNHLCVQGCEPSAPSWFGYLLIAAHASTARHLRNRISGEVGAVTVFDSESDLLESATSIQREVVLLGPALHGFGILGEERVIGFLDRVYDQVAIATRELLEVATGVESLDRYANAVFQMSVERAQHRFSAVGLMFALISLGVGTLALLDLGDHQGSGITAWVLLNVAISIAFISTWRIMRIVQVRR